MRSQKAHTASAAFLVCGSLFLSGAKLRILLAEPSPHRKRDPHTKDKRMSLLRIQGKKGKAKSSMRLLYPFSA